MKGIVIIILFLPILSNSGPFDKVFQDSFASKDVNLLHMSEGDRSFAEYYIKSDIDKNTLREIYESSALDYASCLIEIGRIVTEEEKTRVESILKNEFELKLKAMLVKTQYQMWCQNSDVGYEYLSRIVDTVSKEDIEVYMGELVELYNKVLLVKELGLCVNENRTQSYNKFIMYAKEIFKKSDIINILPDDHLSFRFELAVPLGMEFGEIFYSTNIQERGQSRMALP